MWNSARVLGLALFCAPIGFSANANESLTPSLLECRSISDDSERLACFDNAVAGLSEADSLVTNQTDSSETTVAAAPLTEEERFGREDLKDVQKEKKKKSKAGRTLTSAVVEIAKNKRGKYIVILENGQIWRQLTADTDKLRVPKDASGLGVTIKRKTLGAHVLSLETGNRSIRVERIK